MGLQSKNILHKRLHTQHQYFNNYYYFHNNIDESEYMLFLLYYLHIDIPFLTNVPVILWFSDVHMLTRDEHYELLRDYDQHR